MDMEFSPRDVKRILDTIASGKAADGFRRIVAQSLRGKPVEVAVRVLETMEQASPILAKVLKDTARSLRTMPVSKLASLLESGMPEKPAPKKRALSPARKKALKIQGRYLGLMRGVRSASARAHIKKIVATKGADAAVAEIERMRKRVDKIDRKRSR